MSHSLSVCLQNDPDPAAICIQSFKSGDAVKQSIMQPAVGDTNLNVPNVEFNLLDNYDSNFPSLPSCQGNLSFGDFHTFFPTKYTGSTSTRTTMQKQLKSSPPQKKIYMVKLLRNTVLVTGMETGQLQAASASVTQPRPEGKAPSASKTYPQTSRSSIHSKSSSSRTDTATVYSKFYYSSNRDNRL